MEFYKSVGFTDKSDKHKYGKFLIELLMNTKNGITWQVMVPVSIIMLKIIKSVDQNDGIPDM